MSIGCRRAGALSKPQQSHKELSISSVMDMQPLRNIWKSSEAKSKQGKGGGKMKLSESSLRLLIVEGAALYLKQDLEREAHGISYKFHSYSELL